MLHRLDKGTSRHFYREVEKTVASRRKGEFGLSEKKTSNASKPGTYPRDGGQHPAPAQNATRPSSPTWSGLQPQLEAPNWAIGLRHTEPGSPQKGGQGRAPQRASRRFYLLTWFRARQRFVPERAVGGELARKHAGSTLSAGKAPAHVGPCAFASMLRLQPSRKWGRALAAAAGMCPRAAANTVPKPSHRRVCAAGLVLSATLQPQLQTYRLSSSQRAWSSPPVSLEPQSPSQPLLTSSERRESPPPHLSPYSRASV